MCESLMIKNIDTKNKLIVMPHQFSKDTRWYPEQARDLTPYTIKTQCLNVEQYIVHFCIYCVPIFS